jgi:hypothetical protein
MVGRKYSYITEHQVVKVSERCCEKGCKDEPNILVMVNGKLWYPVCRKHAEPFIKTARTMTDEVEPLGLSSKCLMLGCDKKTKTVFVVEAGAEDIFYTCRCEKCQEKFLRGNIRQNKKWLEDLKCHSRK